MESQHDGSFYVPTWQGCGELRYLVIHLWVCLWGGFWKSVEWLWETILPNVGGHHPIWAWLEQKGEENWIFSLSTWLLELRHQASSVLGLGLILRVPWDLGWNYATSFPGLLACRWQSFLRLHHGESQFLIINLTIKSLGQCLSFPGDSDICLPVMRETQFRSLGQEDTLEKEMATYSSVLAWEIPWIEKPGGLQSKGLQELDMT